MRFKRKPGLQGQTFEIVNNSMRRAKDIIRVQAVDMAHAIEIDAPRRRQLGIGRYLIRKVNTTP